MLPICASVRGCKLTCVSPNVIFCLSGFSLFGIVMQTLVFTQIRETRQSVMTWLKYSKIKFPCIASIVLRDRLAPRFNSGATLILTV